MNRLPIVEQFYSIQGEGYNSGKAAYFVRLAGCNVCCQWCDAKESWNQKNSPLIEIEEIVKSVVESKATNVVITGGEPLLHSLDQITDRLRALEIKVFLETSGSSPLSGKFDWICLSPKQKLHPLEEIFSEADELKVVVREFEKDIEWAENCAKKVKKSCKIYLQPEWGKIDEILPQIIDYVKLNPEWCISLQTHKYMAIP